MGLRGNLATVNLADVFQVLARGNSSGLLRVQGPEGSRFVEIQSGCISMAARATGKILIGDLLVSRNLISQSVLVEALKKQKESGKLLGEMLLEMNAVTLQDMEDALRFQIEEEVCDLFMLKEGEFDFLANATLDARMAPGGGLLRLKIDPDSLLLEAARRADEWKEIDSRIPSQVAVYKLTAAGEKAVSEPEGVSPEGLTLLKLAQLRQTVETIVQKGCLGRLNTNRMLLELIEAGLIEPLPVDEYLKLADERISNNNLEEAERIAGYAMMYGGTSVKKMSQSVMLKIEKQRKEGPVDGARSGPLSDVVGGKKLPNNVFLKEDRPVLPYAGAALVAILLAGGYFLWPAGETGKTSSDDSVRLRTETSLAENLINTGRMDEGLTRIQNFRTENPELKKSALEAFGRFRERIETGLRTEVKNFLAAREKNSLPEMKTSAQNLKQYQGLKFLTADGTNDLETSRKLLDVYAVRAKSEEFKQRLSELQVSGKSKPPHKLLEDYKALLAENPPEDVAAPSRDEVTRLQLALNEAATRLDRGNKLIEAGDSEAALNEFIAAAAAAPETPDAEAADKALTAAKNRQISFLTKFGEIENKVTRRQNDDAKNLLAQFMQSRPPRSLIPRALQLWSGIQPEGDNGPDAQLRDAKLLYDRQPLAGLAKLTELAKKYPTSAEAWNITLRTEVTSLPSGADIYLNGAPAGKTPAVLELPYNTSFTLVLKSENFKPSEVISSGISGDRLNLKMDRLPKVLRLAPGAAKAGFFILQNKLYLCDGLRIARLEKDLRSTQVYELSDILAADKNAQQSQPAQPVQPTPPGAAAPVSAPAPASKMTVPATLSPGATGFDREIYVSWGSALLRITPDAGESSVIRLNSETLAPPVIFPANAGVARMAAMIEKGGIEVFSLDNGKAVKKEPFEPVVQHAAQDSDSVFVCGTGNKLFSFSSKNAAQEWTATLPDAPSAPVAFVPSKSIVAVVTLTGRLTFLDSINGKEKFKRDMGGEAPVGCLALNDNIIVLMNGQCEQIQSGGNSNWSVPLSGKPLLSAVVPFGGKDNIFAFCMADTSGGKPVYTVNLHSGIDGKPLWTARLQSTPEALTFSLDGKELIVSCEDGWIFSYPVK